jgi:hypothetical protein
MPVKAYGAAGSPDRYRWDGGFSWIAHPDESMQRASHAIAVDDEGVPVAGRGVDSAAVWVIEPLDFDRLDDELETFGPVAGVVVLAGLHRRDAAAIASRHGVEVHLSAPISGLAKRIEAPTTVFGDSLAGTGFRSIPLLYGIPWAESLLFDDRTGTLVVTEMLTGGDRGTGPGEQIAVAPYTRLIPPREQLAGLSVERVLLGHGPPVIDNAQDAVDYALTNSFRGLPTYLRHHLDYMLKAAYVALRD